MMTGTQFSRYLDLAHDHLHLHHDYLHLEYDDMMTMRTFQSFPKSLAGGHYIVSPYSIADIDENHLMLVCLIILGITKMLRLATCQSVNYNQVFVQAEICLCGQDRCNGADPVPEVEF